MHSAAERRNEKQERYVKTKTVPNPEEGAGTKKTGFQYRELHPILKPGVYQKKEIIFLHPGFVCRGAVY
jgi:hypothetical protein